MQNNTLYKEIIDEIGTQTLARCGLNIFSFNTYSAYGASVNMTTTTAFHFQKEKEGKNWEKVQRNEPQAKGQYFGKMFERIEPAFDRIRDAFYDRQKSYSTDELYAIKNAQALEKTGKLANGKNPKPSHLKEFEMIKNIFPDEIKNFNFNKGVLKEMEILNAQYDPQKREQLTNHSVIDTVVLNKNGTKIIHTKQLKVIQDTNGLLEDRYLDNVDELRVPHSQYSKHRKELEKNIESAKNSSNPEVIEKARKSQIALDKLNKGNLASKFLHENPRINTIVEKVETIALENPNATAVVTQSVVATGHVAQAGFSDALVVALSTLANGIIWEVKDMCSTQKIDSESSVLDRIKRLIRKVIESFRANFVRGAGFGSIDVAMGVIGQIFKNIAGSLKAAWANIRNSAKSIYNGIYSYIKGEIKDMRTLLKTILKAIFSAAWVVPILALEQKLQAILPFGVFLAPIFAIVAGAFAVVITARSIDLALDTLFGVFAEAEKSRLRAEEIAALVAERLPAIIEKREALQKLIAKEHRERMLSLESSFNDYALALQNADSSGIYTTLNNINKLFGKELQIKTIEDVKTILQNENRTGLLKW